MMSACRRAQVQLLVHHSPHPDVTVTRDRLHHTVEQIAVEAFGGIDIADLLALDVWHRLNLAPLSGPFRLVVVAFRNGRRVADRTHRDRIRDGRSEAYRQEHRVRATRRDDTEDDAK